MVNYIDKEAKVIGELLSKHTKDKDKKIDEAIERIRKYLTKRNISSFSRSFLINMLYQYMDICERSKTNMISSILGKLPHYQSCFTRSYLGLDRNHIDRIRLRRRFVETYYYFQ